MPWQVADQMQSPSLLLEACSLSLAEWLPTDSVSWPHAGHILLTASVAGLGPLPPFVVPTYCAAKAGLLNFMRSAAPALLEKGVRINAVCPTVIYTALVGHRAVHCASS